VSDEPWFDVQGGQSSCPRHGRVRTAQWRSAGRLARSVEVLVKVKERGAKILGC
jgi:D-hexose-6-phosphate mutarotase